MVERGHRERLDSFGFDDPSGAWIESLRLAEAPVPCGRLGRYHLIEEISRGGQGIVYRALEAGSDHPVAVKRLLGGSFASESARRRFELELEALSALDHPGVVGALAMDVVDGTPVLAMEWIDGVPISIWARGQTRSPREVARLVQRVCLAVHHAHQHGVLHRDLKPSNILIDREGEPHVLDFGLAKLIDQSQSPEAQNTLSGRFVGTVSYASLERLYGGASVDVRSDVYSLGAVMYELLTGRQPYGDRKTEAATARAIERGELAPPSSVVPGIDPDLEAITLKALAAAKETRYQSADALASDLRRYLALEPVEARTLQGWSRLRSALRRHPLATTVFVLVSTFGAVTAHLAARYADQRDQAWAAERREAEARARAEQEAARARAINAFHHGLLSSVQPGMDGRDVTVRDVLDRAAANVGHSFPDQPVVEADIRNTVGMTYKQLGFYEKAESQLRASVEILRGQEDADDADLGTCLNSLGMVLGERGRYREAEDALREALSIRRRHLPEHRAVVAETVNNLAAVLHQSGHLSEAESMYREALAVKSELLGADHPKVASILSNLALALDTQGDPAGAEALYREALAIQRERLGETHPAVALSLNNLGGCLLAQGKHAPAEPLLREALARMRRRLGDHHPQVASCLDNLTGVTFRLGRLDEAEAFARESLALGRRSLGDDHPSVAISRNNLGRLLLSREKPSEAEGLLRRALETGQRTLPAGHWHTALFALNYGGCLTRLARHEEAEKLLLESHASLTTKFGAQHEHTQRAVENLAVLYTSWGKEEQAATWSARRSKKTEK